MAWVKTQAQRNCGRHNALTQRWILEKDDGQVVAEATFCSLCSPDLVQIFADVERGSATTLEGGQADEVTHHRPAESCLL